MKDGSLLHDSHSLRSVIVIKAANNQCECAVGVLVERVSARAFDRPVVALHVRMAWLSRFSQIGRPQTVPVVAVA